MMETRIEVFLKEDVKDNIGEGIKGDIKDLGIKKVKRIETAQIYLLEGKIFQSQKKMICENLLIDPLIQEYQINYESRITNYEKPYWIVEVWPKKGVTDTVAETTEKGIRDLGINGIKKVRTGKKYLLIGSLSSEETETISQRLLANKVIENYSITQNA